MVLYQRQGALFSSQQLAYKETDPPETISACRWFRLETQQPMQSFAAGKGSIGDQSEGCRNAWTRLLGTITAIYIRNGWYIVLRAACDRTRSRRADLFSV